MNSTEELKAAARKAGADLVGVADLALFKMERATLPPDLLEPYDRAVAVCGVCIRVCPFGKRRAGTPKLVA